jgi:D-3-phosphoglycerate dehydrogenase / 2-oxoglutarate reductase
MDEKTVLVTDYTWPSTEPEARVLAEIGAKLLIAQTGSEEELLSLVPQADGILTCFKKVSAAVIRAGEKLQVVGRYGIGVDNIAVDEATRLGIPVTNVPAYCLDEVAEHVLALMLACARKVCQYNAAVHEGNWSLQTGMPIYRVRGRTLGIVGFGKIGQSLADKARGLGLNIIAYDPYMPDETIRQRGAESRNLDDLLAQADFVSLHTPLTPDTRGLLNADRLRRMKPTAFVVNTARGGLIVTDALTQALQEGWIAGAALDVFDPEPLPADHPLLSQPTLIATPHVAFYSEESVQELEVLAARNVAAILSGQRPAWVVNPEVLTLPRWAHLR